MPKGKGYTGSLTGSKGSKGKMSGTPHSAAQGLPKPKWPRMKSTGK